MFTQQDAQNIEQLALLIFEHNRTLVDLSNLQNTEQFLTVINLFPKILVPYNSDDYSCEEKIYLIFEQHVHESSAASVVLGAPMLHYYHAQNISVLFDRLKNIELKIYSYQGLIDILEYMKDLVEIATLNKIVFQEISKKMLDSNSLNNSLLGLNTIDIMSQELLQKYNSTLQEFNSIGVAKSTCVDMLCKQYHEVCGFLGFKVAKYIITEFDSITKDLFESSKEKHVTDKEKIDYCKCRLKLQKSNLPEVSTIAYIINMLIHYLDIIELINCCNNKEVWQNAYAIYYKLNILSNAKFNISDILPIKELCEYMANKLFDPIEKSSTRKKLRKHECLFDGLMFDDEYTNMLSDAWAVLAFFEKYVSLENKSTLLSLKYRIIKKYNASLGFDSNSLQVQPNLKLTNS